MIPRWLTVTAYARAYSVNRKTVYKWLDAGLLTTFTAYKTIRIADSPPKSLDSKKEDGK